ncbi:MAG: hypothetical protein RMA76_36365 [Deltaproteobacteria bacterium]|jgi:hypothetical protein
MVPRPAAYDNNNVGRLVPTRGFVMIRDVRVGAMRAWLRGAVNTTVGRARSIGHAISRRIKDATGAISAGVGVGDDESNFGGGRSVVWLEFVEEYKNKLLAFMEKSVFERFPGVEKFMRRVLGAPKRPPPALPTPERPKVPVKLGVHTPPTNEEAERFRQQIHMGMMKAHQEEHAGLRDHVDRHRARGRVEPTDPDEERDPHEPDEEEDANAYDQP